MGKKIALLMTVGALVGLVLVGGVSGTSVAKSHTSAKHAAKKAKHHKAKSTNKHKAKKTKNHKANKGKAHQAAAIGKSQSSGQQTTANDQLPTYLLTGTVTGTSTDATTGTNSFSLKVKNANDAAQSYIGKKVNITLTPQTQVTMNNIEANASDIKTGDKVQVQSDQPASSSNTFTASTVNDGNISLSVNAPGNDSEEQGEDGNNQLNNPQSNSSNIPGINSNSQGLLPGSSQGLLPELGLPHLT